MISTSLQAAATALAETAGRLEPAALGELVPLLACGLALANREMLMHLLETEVDWLLP